MAERKDAEASPPADSRPIPGFEGFEIYHGPVSPAIVALAGLLGRQAAREDFEEAAKRAAAEAQPGEQQDDPFSGAK